MIKNFRKKGYLAEKKAREFFSKHFYVIPKGISTKGVDIVALNESLIVVCEVKFFNNSLIIKEKQIKNLFEEEKKIKKYFKKPVIKLVILTNYKEMKFLEVKEIKDLKIKKEDFNKMKELSYYNLLGLINI